MLLICQPCGRGTPPALWWRADTYAILFVKLLCDSDSVLRLSIPYSLIVIIHLCNSYSLRRVW